MDKEKKCIVCSVVGSSVTNHCAGGLVLTMARDTVLGQDAVLGHGIALHCIDEKFK